MFRVTGNVGSAVGRELLARGYPVRSVIRDETKGASWAERGAQVAVTDLSDRAGLSAALRGSAGAFFLLPTDPRAPDFLRQQDRMVTAIAGAVAEAGVPHVALLSSLGAEMSTSTSLIEKLGELEERMRETGTILTAVRCGHFQEELATVLGAA